MAKNTKATQKNDKTEKSPKKRARTRGNNQSVNIARSRDTSAETVLKGWQTKTRQPPPQTRHNSLPSKMTSISSSKTRYTCAPMRKSLMTKQWRKKWFTALHTPCPKKQTTPTQSPLRAQTAENHDHTEEKTTIMEDQPTLTFGGQDETEDSTNAQASFGDYDREMGQETIPPHCQIQARPVLGEQPKTLTPPKSAQESNQERTKQTGNSRKMRRIIGVRHADDEDFIAKKARNQSRKIVENDKKFTDQSDGTENDKNNFQQGVSLTSSSEATGDQKET